MNTGTIVEISSGRNFHGFIVPDRANSAHVYFKRAAAYAGCRVGDRVRFVESMGEKGPFSLYVRRADFVPKNPVLPKKALVAAQKATPSQRRVQHQAERVMPLPYERIVKLLGTAYSGEHW